MQQHGIKAITLNAENLQAYGNTNEVYAQLRRCEWPVIIVSPEWLVTPEFDRLLRDDYFRRNLALYVIDEAHVVVSWGASFRWAYSDIGGVCLRIPPETPILAMTAMCRPTLTQKILDALCISKSGTEIIRRACEKPNLQLVFQSLTHGLAGEEFPSLQWLTRRLCKAIVYCASIDLCHRVARYLRRLFPPGDGRRESVRVYNGLISSRRNEEALTAFNNDPRTLIIIAMIKFGMGIDVHSAQVVVNLGLPDLAEDDLQQKGRAGRVPTVDACGITYVEPGVITSALATLRGSKNHVPEKAAGCSSAPELADNTTPMDHTPPLADVTVDGARRGRWANLDDGLRRLVLCHIKKECLVAETNVLFGSPGEDSHMTCFKAKRRLPCSSCLDSNSYSQLSRELAPLALAAPAPSPSSIERLSASIAMLSTDTSQTSDTVGLVQEGGFIDSEAPDLHRKRLKLTPKMLVRAKMTVNEFACFQWWKWDTLESMLLPHVLYIPFHLQDTLFRNFHTICSHADLVDILLDWEFVDSDSDVFGLFDVVHKCNEVFDKEHIARKVVRDQKAATTRQMKAAASSATYSAGMWIEFRSATHS